MNSSKVSPSTNLPIANALAFLLMIVFNYFGSNGFFNGKSIAEVSSEYPTLFTPASYAFGIWSLIYLLLLGFVIFQLRSFIRKKPMEDAVSQIGWWFVISCLSNCGWVLSWVYENLLLSVLWMVLLFYSLMKIVLRTGMELSNPPLKIFAFVWWPFCIYSGWISIALVPNVAAFLEKIQWNRVGFSEEFWAITLLVIAGAVHVFMRWKRNMREFTAAGIWGIAAVAVANWNALPLISYAAFAVCLLVGVSSLIHLYQNRKSLPF